MEPGTLGSFLLGVVFLLPVILITVLCVGCWGYKSSNARIPQNIADYEDEPNFRVVRPNTFPQQSNHKPNTLQPSFHSTAHTGVTSSSPVHTLSPVVNSRRTSATPQEDNESVPSYENEENEAVDVGDYVNEEDEQPGEGYIEVLPDAPAPVCGSVSQQSLMSAASSANENYVNLKEDDAASENFVTVPTVCPVSVLTVPVLDRIEQWELCESRGGEGRCAEDWILTGQRQRQ
ncbi:linker for activation of T-cells family member 1-like isoform X2 [Lepisosteus oculatus]|uniref:linker for activation of T-cells family member 1-like isoform X2 n=1 Tax=Lepisosteus oculatus TaxID=7918 RepID=UPI003712F310